MPERERFGDFLLHERLAVGGMGELYLATRAERRSPPFALKIMARSYRENPEFLSMFQDEAKIGMRLSHSNIVGVHEIGTAEETSYIVMEYVHGENLRSVLRTMDRLGEKMAPALAVKMAIDVLRGLDHAHQATDADGRKLHLVHRDLSPDNILVSYQGEVKLLDFGIAKAAGRTTTTQVGVVKGKPQYMSPEQAKAKIVDARSDLFSAAVVLRELLTGERRFVDDDLRWESARNWSPRPIPGMPGELDSIVLRALEPEPSRRFQTADELATELTRVARSGVLPRAKESLPALLKRLFPVASARKFDATDVTLFQAPRWSSEGTPDNLRGGAPNLATSSSTIPMGPMPFGSIDAGPTIPPSADEDETAPAADLARMQAALHPERAQRESPLHPERAQRVEGLSDPTTVAVPETVPIGPTTVTIPPAASPNGAARTLSDVPVGPTTVAVPPSRPAVTPRSGPVGTTPRPAVPPRSGPVGSTPIPSTPPRPILPRSMPVRGDDDPTSPQADLSEMEPGAVARSARDRERATTSSGGPPMSDRRQALRALAVLVPLSAVGVFALWRLWPREPEPETPPPTPRPAATPRPTVRRKPTPRPTKKKPTPTPRRR